MKLSKKFITIIFISTLFLLKGCASLGPSVPNKPYPGPYPEEFSYIKKNNPLLATEFGKLPEIQDGISEIEQVAMDQIIELYRSDPVTFDNAFKQMYKVGLPEVRKYCTPLQALLWLSQDGSLNATKNPIQNYTLKSLLDVAWFDSFFWTDTERWNDFQTVVDRLNSPELLDYYERHVIQYKYRPGFGEGPEEASRVFHNKYGHCAQITAFTVHILQRAGYKAYRHLISHPALRSPKGNLHRVCVFIVNGRKYIMDNGRRRPYGIIRFEDYNPMLCPSIFNYHQIWKELSED